MIDFSVFWEDTIALIKLEWYLNGPGVFTASLVSVAVNLVLLAILFKDRRNLCSLGSIYAGLVALVGILMVGLEQADFLRDFVYANHESKVVRSLREIAQGGAVVFLRSFFPQGKHVLLVLAHRSAYWSHI